MEYLGDGSKFGVQIHYSVHSVEGGTGEGFRLAIKRHIEHESFFALNGDQITDLNLNSMYRTHTRAQAMATIGLVHPRLPFGLVVADKDGYCKGFIEKPIMKSVTCSSGIYVFQRDIVDYLPKRGDVEMTTFPRLSREKRLKVYVHRGSFLTVNSLRELEEVENDLKGRRQN